MTEESKQSRPAQNRNPYTIWFVVLSFVAPVVLAYLVFYFVDVSSFNNHGELLNPMVEIDTMGLMDEESQVIPKKTLTYKWRFISFVGSDCDEACNKRLYETRQVHRALGKNQHRLLRVIVHLDQPSESLNTLIKEEYADALIMFANEADIQQVLGDTARLRENELYIMDPMGRIMMRFTQDQPSKQIKHDIYKLLKASQIG